MQEIYVETWGNDNTGDGSKSNPYLTLYKAVSSITEDANIYLGKGSFAFDGTYAINYSLTIKGNNDKTIIYKKNGTSDTNIICTTILIQNCIIRNDRYGINYCVRGTLKLINCVVDCLNNCIFQKVSNLIFYANNCLFVGEGRPIYSYTEACISHSVWLSSLEKNNITFESSIDITSDDYNPETYRLTNADNSKYGVYSGEYAWGVGYLLYMDNKYYSILPNHYVDGAYQEVDLATVKADENASDNYLFSPSALFEDLTIGEGESAVTFKPIEKFDNFQLVKINSEELPESLTVSGLKVNNAMISMIVPVSMKKYNVIHSVTATYEGTVRLAFSFDKGTTWKTFNTTDGVWEDLFIDIALKDYASYTVNDNTNWNKAKAKILTDGIDPADLEVTDLINFNINAKTMLVAAAMERKSYSTPSSFSGLTILYDSPNTYERVESTQCKVAITGDTIEVTPTFASNELLITAVTNL